MDLAIFGGRFGRDVLGIAVMSVVSEASAILGENLVASLRACATCQTIAVFLAFGVESDGLQAGLRSGFTVVIDGNDAFFVTAAGEFDNTFEVWCDDGGIGV